jgi:hypothetical protein
MIYIQSDYNNNEWYRFQHLQVLHGQVTFQDGEYVSEKRYLWNER